jgi:O-antigen/teichoic acid export membrane protein
MALAGARATSLLTALVSVPLVIRDLGPELFGVWVTIASVLAVLRVADFGLGGGVTTAVAQSHGREDHAALRSYVSTAFFLLTAIALVLGACYALFGTRIDWASVFNVSLPSAADEVNGAMTILAFCMLARLPLTVVERTQVGSQEGYVAGAWEGIGNLLALAGIVLCVLLDAGLEWLVLALAGGPLLAALANSVIWFGRRRPELRPRWGRRSRAASSALVRLGALFFVLDVSIVIAFLSDNIVAARIFGAEEVATYAVPWRLFTIAPVVIAIAVMPLWPAYGEAIPRGDLQWVRRTLGRSLVVALAASIPIALLLLAFASPIIDVWAGPEIDPSFSLLAGLAAWSVLSSVGAAIAVFLNGAGIMRLQVICAVLMAVTNLVLSIVLAHKIGLEGIIFGTVIAYMCFIVLPYSVAVPRLLKRLPGPPVAE